MGCGFFGHNSSSLGLDRNGTVINNYTRNEASNINPDPSNFRIIDAYKGKYGVAVLVKYPNCTNYEGKKILVYLNVDFGDVFTQEMIDPHFQDNQEILSPLHDLNQLKKAG